MRFARKPRYSVSEKTIANCFKKFGFIFSRDNDEIPEVEHCEREIPSEEQDMIISKENEHRPSFEDYVNVDDAVLVTGIQNDEDIISSHFAIQEEDTRRR